MLYLPLFCRFLKRDIFYESIHSFRNPLTILELFVVIHVAFEKKCCIVDVLTMIKYIKVSHIH